MLFTILLIVVILDGLATIYSTTTGFAYEVNLITKAITPVGALVLNVIVWFIYRRNGGKSIFGYFILWFVVLAYVAMCFNHFKIFFKHFSTVGSVPVVSHHQYFIPSIHILNDK